MLQPLHITAKEGTWRLFMVRRADPKFQQFKNSVLKRDQYQCQFCGFCAQTQMEVVNLDGNYHNNKPSNLHTACPLCAQCLFIEAIGKSDFGGGSLIYLPEMTQGELNGLCHTLFNALISHNSQQSDAKTIYRSLRLRSQAVEKVLGEGMSNPALYGQLLIDTQHSNKAAIEEKVAATVRVLPQLARFVPLFESWQTHSLQAMRGHQPCDNSSTP